MNTEAAGDVLAFQTWLHQSIRRAWVFAIAVAIPGALLVTLWFPHSELALVIVAAIGISIGVISDAVEQARKRRRDESSEIIAAVEQAVQNALGSREKPTGQTAPGVDEATLTSHLAVIRSELERSSGSNAKILEDVAVIRSLLTVTLMELRAQGHSVPNPFSQLEPPSGKYFQAGYDPLVGTDQPLHYFSSKQLINPLLMPLEGFLPGNWVENPLFREILTKVNRLAQERGVSVITLVRYLNYVASNTKYFSQVQQQTEETH